MRLSYIVTSLQTCTYTKYINMNMLIKHQTRSYSFYLMQTDNSKRNVLAKRLKLSNSKIKRIAMRDRLTFMLLLLYVVSQELEVCNDSIGFLF